jgi:hypothetical protein
MAPTISHAKCATPPSDSPGPAARSAAGDPWRSSVLL